MKGLTIREYHQETTLDIPLFSIRHKPKYEMGYSCQVTLCLKKKKDKTRQLYIPNGLTKYCIIFYKNKEGLHSCP